MTKATRYDWCGLRDVFLLNGVLSRATPYGPAVSVEDLEELHSVICRQLARDRVRLSGDEVRFMRQTLGLTQVDLGVLLCCTGQSVARWEKEEVGMPALHALALRALILSRLDGPVDMMQLSADTALRSARVSRMYFRFEKGLWTHVATAPNDADTRVATPRKTDRPYARQARVS